MRIVVRQVSEPSSSGGCGVIPYERSQSREERGSAETIARRGMGDSGRPVASGGLPGGRSGCRSAGRLGADPGGWHRARGSTNADDRAWTVLRRLRSTLLPGRSEVVPIMVRPDYIRVQLPEASASSPDGGDSSAIRSAFAATGIPMPRRRETPANPPDESTGKPAETSADKVAEASAATGIPMPRKRRSAAAAPAPEPAAMPAPATANTFVAETPAPAPHDRRFGSVGPGGTFLTPARAGRGPWRGEGL